MEITNIKVKLVNSVNEKFKAVASITIDNAIAVHDIKILEHNEKYFLAMPYKKMPNGSLKDIVHPINNEYRELITKSVLAEYEKVVNETSNEE